METFIQKMYTSHLNDTHLTAIINLKTPVYLEKFKKKNVKMLLINVKKIHKTKYTYVYNAFVYANN